MKDNTNTAMDEEESMMKQIADIPIGQVTTGIDASAAVLQTRSDDVMLCILPSTTHDNISIRIEQKLIEAFCLEADIQVIRVDRLELVTAAFPQAFGNKTVTDAAADDDDGGDHGCVVICYPERAGDRNAG